MQPHKNRAALGRMASPFPFSAYIVKSYSSESPDKRPDSKTHLSNLEEEEFLGLVKGLRMRETEILDKIDKVEKFTRKHIILENVMEGVTEPDIKIRKPLFRTREKRAILPKSQTIIKVRITENKVLAYFYRYQLVSLLTLMNRRQDYLNSLRGKMKELNIDPLKSEQIQERLKKQLETKGKDKGRTKFNHITNQQLRSLKYKAKSLCQSLNKKQSKAQYDDQEEEDDEDVQEHEEKIKDIQSWKRQNGCGFYQKVFIIKGGYHQLRRALVEKGWFENEDVWSPFFDLKWTTRICDINYLNIRNGQAVNHFNNNHHLTSKYGITRRLRTLALGHGIDVDRFYPRCFDLGDQVDFQNFVENFKYGFAESIARRFLQDKKRYVGLELKVRIVFDVLKRRTMRFTATINSINRGQFLTVTPEEWLIITQTSEFDEQTMKEKLEVWRRGQTEDPEDPEYQQNLYSKIDTKIRSLLQTLKNQDPQIQMNGFRNTWIAKPNFMSRGRGIRCFNNLYDIADYCLGRDCQFVVQKYIQNPLIIDAKKFDIRQWVLVQDFNPPKIWFYDECYIRFCADDYSLDNIYNRHMHLTNHSVAKYSKNNNIDKSMWTMKQFSQFLGEEKWKEVQQKMKNIIVWSIKSCEGHITGRRGSNQLFGYDFMIDQNLNPWLIQVNMSPSMEYSTPVTKKLVKMVLQDTAKVISGNKKNRNTGLFSCIYKSNQDLEKFTEYKFDAKK